MTTNREEAIALIDAALSEHPDALEVRGLPPGLKFILIERWDGSELLEQFLIPAAVDAEATVKRVLKRAEADWRKDHPTDSSSDEVIDALTTDDLMFDGWSWEEVVLWDPRIDPEGDGS